MHYVKHVKKTIKAIMTRIANGSLEVWSDKGFRISLKDLHVVYRIILVYTKGKGAMYRKIRYNFLKKQ